MIRYGLGCVFLVLAIATAAGPLKAADTPAPTFSKDVLPILQKNCQSCHRPGQIGPFSLLSYETTRPWARSIKAKVESRQMPPWFADPQHGRFANDRSLAQREIDTIVKWVDGGAPQGDPRDAPAAIEWAPDGWQIKPDLIVRGPEFRVPARPEKNVIEWTTMVIPSGFTRDTWITSVEVKPSELAVTHHICISFVPHRPNVKYYTMNWTEAPRDEDGNATDRRLGSVAAGQAPPPPANATPPAGGGAGTGTGVGGGFWCYVPGVQADDYRPYGAGKLVPANVDISIQLHYTPTGREVVDRPLFGFTVADAPPQRQWLATQVSGAGPTFAIPPNDPNWTAPPAQVEFLADVELVQMMPHMHLRGKDMTYHVLYPDGRDEIVLSVPKYDFNWQMMYQPAKPIRIPKGSKLRVEAHYNNSPSNKFNPDPNRTVYPGRMTWEEMFNPFFGLLIDKDTNPSQVLKLLRGTVTGDGA
jgi:hypothetical protein